MSVTMRLSYRSWTGNTTASRSSWPTIWSPTHTQPPALPAPPPLRTYEWARTNCLPVRWWSSPSSQTPRRHLIHTEGSFARESESPNEPESQKADLHRNCRRERPRRPRLTPISRFTQTPSRGISGGRRIDPRSGRVYPAHGLRRRTRRHRGARPQIDPGRDGPGALWIGGRYGSAQPGLREGVGAGERRQHHPWLAHESRGAFRRFRERRGHPRGRLRRHAIGGGRRPRLRPPDSPHGAGALSGAGAR